MNRDRHLAALIVAEPVGNGMVAKVLGDSLAQLSAQTVWSRACFTTDHVEQGPACAEYRAKPGLRGCDSTSRLNAGKQFRSSREAAGCESPARKCRERKVTGRVRFSGRHQC